MRQPPTNICPMLAIAGIGSTSNGPAVCLMDRCAWFDYGENGCAVVSLADHIADVAAELTDMEGDTDGG